MCDENCLASVSLSTGLGHCPACWFTSLLISPWVGLKKGLCLALHCFPNACPLVGIQYMLVE